MLRDFNSEWLEKRIFIPWVNMTGVIQAVAAGVLFRSQVSATALAAAVASAQVGKLGIGAQNDGVSHLWMAPYDLDIKKQLRFRVHFTQTATSGTVTWQILYQALLGTMSGTAGATVIAVAGTALDTIVPAASGTVVANDYRITDFGVINRGIIPDTTDALNVKVLCTDSSPVAGLGLLGLEIRYTPRKMAGPRRNILGGRRLNTGRPLGTILAVAQEGL